MSVSNSRRDLRLRLEGCSTGEESEDEPQVSQQPSETLSFSVTRSICRARFVVNAITCCVFLLQDTRTHVVVELYDTERSYVESLQILVTVSLYVYILLRAPIPRYNVFRNTWSHSKAQKMQAYWMPT